MNEEIASPIEGQSIEKFFQTYLIPEEKIDIIAAHFQGLRKKFPQMKYDRIFKKTANYFNLKKSDA